MRPLFDKGFKPESFANMLMELHSSQFTTECLRHEYKIKGRRMINGLGLPSPVKEKPLVQQSSSNWGLQEHVYITEHNLIRHHLEREVKKCDAEVLITDVSYKESKALYQYKGKQ
ncbi:hypothetical protein ACHAWO_007466 [Cyclotella atomus]|uniref:Transposase n=1 Tax=Cyclotella atomus TaxID=382360 RepID=A0ABD3P3G0_9STRA